MDYSNLEDWEIQVYASEAELSVEDWKAEQDAGKKNGPTTSPVAGPMPDGDSNSVNTSSALPGPRFVVVNGITVNEEDYIKNQAGKGRFPDTFEEYARLQKVQVQEYDDVIPESLSDLTVTAEFGEEAKENIKQAEALDTELTNINPYTQRARIVKEYLGLQDVNEDNNFTPKVIREQYFPEIPNSGGRKSGNAEFKNDFETDIKNSLGPKKYEVYKKLKQLAFQDSFESNGEITEEVIKKYYDDLNIPTSFVEQVVYERKQSKAEQFYRGLDEDEQDDIQLFRGDSELQAQKMAARNEKTAAAQKDEDDYFDLTGRRLMSPQTVMGRKYVPRSYVAKGFTDVVSENIKGLEEDFKIANNQNKNLKKQWDDILLKKEDYESELADIDQQLEGFNTEEFETQFMVDEYNKLVSRRNQITKSGDFEKFLNNWESLANETESYKERVDFLIEKNKGLVDQKIGQDAALKSYDALTRLGQVWEEFTLGSISGLAVGFYELAEDFAATQGEVGLAFAFNQAKQSHTNYHKRLAEKRERLLPKNLTYDDVKEGDGLGWNYFTEGLINNSPSIVLAMIPTGGVALSGLSGAAKIAALTRASKIVGGVFGISEAGGYLRETDLAVNNAEEARAKLYEQLDKAEGLLDKQLIEEQIKEQDELLDLSSFQKAFNAVGYGAIANYSERLGSLGFLGRWSKYSEAVGYDTFLKLSGGREGIARVVSSNLGTLKGLGTGVGIEIIEETATQLGQNLLDITVGQQSKSLFEGLDADFALNVAISSIAMAGPSAGSNIYNSVVSEFKTQKEIKQNTELSNALIGLQEKLDQSNLKPEERKSLRSQRRTILQKLAISDVVSLAKVKQMNSEDVLEVAEIQRKKRDLTAKAKVLGNTQLEFGDRDKLQSLEKQYEELDSRREELLGKPEAQAIEAMKGAKNPIQAAFNYQNYLFNLEMAKFAGKDVNVVADVESIDNLDLTEDQKNKAKKAYGTDTQVGSNAIIIDGKIIIFESNIMERITQSDGIEAAVAAVSPLHEVGHAEAAAQGLIKDGKLVGDAKRVINGITSYVSNLAAGGKMSKEDFENFTNRIEAYKTDEGVDVDELIQLVADFTNAGILDKSAYDKVWQIKSFVNRSMQALTGDSHMLFKVNTSQDVFNFVSSWTKKAMQGRRLTAPEDFVGSKESKSVSQLAKVKTAFEKLSVEEAKENPMVEGEMYNMIEVQAQKTAVWSSLDMDTRLDFVGNVYARTLKDIRNNPWNGTGTLYGYINGRIKNRILDEFKADRQGEKTYTTKASNDAIERLEREIDNETQKTTEAANAEVVEKNKSPEKNKFKTLTEYKTNDGSDTKFISNSQLGQIERTVANIVGSKSFDSKFDERASDGKQASDFINTVKKFLGKSIIIDALKKNNIVKSKGGNTQQAFERFMLQNKKAVLENMTTTYLQTAFPHAIEKSVNGVFVRFPAWLGQKIDREATGQGNDLVRRVPNVSNAVTNEQYLQDIRTNSLKGGKEVRSAAKANSVFKALAEEIGIEIFVNALQDENSIIYKSLIRRQAELGITEDKISAIEASLQAERGSVKFSNGLVELQRQGANVRSLFELGLPKSVDKTINKYYKLQGINPVMDFESKDDIDTWFENTKEHVISLYSFNTFFNSETPNKTSAFRNSPRHTGKNRKREIIVEGKKITLDDYFVQKINNLRALDKGLFGEEVFTKEELEEKFSGKVPSSNYEVSIGKDEQGFEKRRADGTWEKFNNYYGTTHAEYWQRTNLKVKEASDLLNSKNAEEKAKGQAIMNALGKYFTAVSNDTNHWHKMGAQVVGYSTNIVGSQKEGERDIEMEHAMPATKAYIYLLDAALNGKYDFNLAYNLIMANYKLIALDADLNKKLAAAGLSTGMPKGWDLLLNDWWERYSEAGIDLSTIIGLDGNPFTEYVGVNKDGVRLTSKGVDFLSKINQESLIKAKENIKDIEQLKIKESKGTEDLNRTFNEILERKTGIESFKTFSDVQAEIRGRGKGRFKFFIAPAVDDFRGLVNFAFSGKGKQGEIDKQWLEDNLMTPYAKGIAAIEGIRQQIKRDFKEAVKSFPKQYKLLNQSVGTTPFTYDHALRVYLWQKAGITTIPGLSKKDTKVLQDAIQAQPELMNFGDSLLTIARRDAWMEPTAHWVGGTVLSDLNGMTEKIGRKKYLDEFIQNAEVVFSPENLNKIEAAFGKDHREAIEDSLYSMINGTNRTTGTNKTVGKWLNWINGSTGAIMFFNRRSALLQMLSTVNFINYSDNNPLKAAAAFANQKQYWKDFAMIFNSDKLKERRGGLQQDVSANEIASIANQNKRSPQALLAYLLKIGFTPTQIADSMAIASGGATFYRNRINTYLKQGLSQKEAEERALLDFSKISDETQQSSDPALVSQIQRSVLGRIVFAFQNTPMQMTRLMKKDALDLINGRGDWKVKVSRIAYYGMIQNAIFSSLQSALFALIPGFDDEDEEDLTEEELIKKNTREEGKIARALNSMLDTLLRGSGVYGAILAASKNVIREYNKQEEKGFLGDHSYTILSLFDISPPIGSKARKINTAIKTRTFEKDAIAERGWAVTAEGRLNLGPNWSILGNVVSATTNVPLDRVVAELTSVSEAMNAKHTAWQRVAMGAGWKTWDVGVKNEVNEKIKEEAKVRRKKEGVIKAAETRERKRLEKREQEFIEDSVAYYNFLQEALQEQDKE